MTSLPMDGGTGPLVGNGIEPSEVLAASVAVVLVVLGAEEGVVGTSSTVTLVPLVEGAAGVVGAVVLHAPSVSAATALASRMAARLIWFMSFLLGWPSIAPDTRTRSEEVQQVHVGCARDCNGPVETVPAGVPRDLAQN